MTTATLTTERVAEAIGNLIDQFKSQANIEALISAWAQQSQELETAAFGLLGATALATAAGVQLDGLGSVVGVERAGRSDADYRLRIGAQILLNNASGTIEDLIQLCVALGATAVTLTEVQPAKLEIEATTVLTNGDEIARIMGQAKTAGVGIWFTWFEDASPFTLDTAGQGLDQGALGDAANT